MVRFRLTLRMLLSLVAALAVVAQHQVMPPWWQYWQSIRTLTG